MDKRTATILEQLAEGRIPRDIPDDTEYSEELARLAGYLELIENFTLAISNGDLTKSLTGVRGPVAGSLKSLQASLRHLTWQATQIADGDFSQRVAFMGEFSTAFNSMVEHLGEARTALEAMNVRLSEDVIQLRNLAAALRESEERFRLIAENVSDVIWTLDVAMERFTYISPSIAHLRGLTVEEAMNETLDQALTPASLLLLRELLASKVALFRGTGDVSCFYESTEVEQTTRDGRIIPVEVVISAITDADGNLKEFVGISRDITARKKAEELLKYISTHDSQTGLYNRAYFDAELERAAGGRQFPVSIIVADLDGLKKVNDTLGHEAGDRLIKGAAAVLKLAFRGNDVIARTGGDEFVVILYGMDEQGVAVSLDRIRECAKCLNEEYDCPPVSLSLGAATAMDGEEVCRALKEADERMYADKLLRKMQRQG